MASQAIISDRGHSLEVDGVGLASHRGALSARLGSLKLCGGGFSFWIQFRGTSSIHAREGRFVLRPGDWIALDRDSAPEIQSGRHGLTAGILVAVASRCQEPLPGRGHLTPRDLRIALRLWRNGVAASAADPSAMEQLIRRLEGICQESTSEQGRRSELTRCPGRSARRKRQVYARLQRARLFLEGNRHRVVRLGELAELTSFSSWYLSKTFHEIYEESPQAASVRLRLERACELLMETDLAIGEVGAACGFDNNCSFARAFRKHFGLSASTYRRRQLTPRSARPSAMLRVTAAQHAT